MKVSKKLLVSLLLFVGMGLLKVSGVNAGIKDSPHDLISWTNNATTIGVKTKAGICAYCHIPHSAKGDRLFPEQTSSEVDSYGKVAGLCYKCHGNNTYIGGFTNNAAYLNNEIFASLDNVKSDSTMDSHPIKGTGFNRQPNTLQNTSLDTVFNAPYEWPWSTTTFDAKVAGVAEIECSTCHNPHDWNANAYGSSSVGLAKRKFLRAPIYDPNGPVGLKNFCSYCHQNRENSMSSNTTGTHPVSAGGQYSGDSATFQEWRAANSGALAIDQTYMIKGLSDSARLSNPAVDKSGWAVWDSTNIAGFIGARVFNPNGAAEVLCQSCHMPHGVMHSDDDVYNDTVGTAELNVGPLLAINNATNWTKINANRSSAPAPYDSLYPFTSETTYNLPTGHQQNLLCEWCHGMTPDLESNSNDTVSFAHPVNMYPTNTIGQGTMDNMPSETEFGLLRIKYPAASWLKYRESLGIRSATNAAKLPAQTARTNNAYANVGGYRANNVAYLVCESCHEPHKSLPGTPLLKFDTAVTDTTFCDGCHYDTAMGVGNDTLYFTDWTTHPSGVTARLINQEGGVLPNRAGLRIFDSTVAADAYISCWTCHKAHKGVEKPLLADYQSPYSQICVNCHTQGSTTSVAYSQNAQWAYGTTATGTVTNANPSYYYVEGVNASGTSWWTRNTRGAPAAYAIRNEARLGSHFIGRYATDPTKGGAARTLITAAGGWLGERSNNRSGASGVTLQTIDHRPNTDTATMGDLKDKWLQQQYSDSTYDTDMVFETMVWIGSGQVAHTNSKTHVICQSCHVAHNSAVGVADNGNISRLLLSSNVDSYMCKRCHIPEADTTLTHPMSVDTTGLTLNAGLVTAKQLNFKYNTLVTRTGTVVNMTSGKYAYAYNSTSVESCGVIAPANYPDTAGIGGSGKRMNCDACHSAHNADSKMGAMILEGCDTAASYANTIPSPYWNKVPTMMERDDKVTCDLCHMQGK